MLQIPTGPTAVRPRNEAPDTVGGLDSDFSVLSAAIDRARHRAAQGLADLVDDSVAAVTAIRLLHDDTLRLRGDLVDADAYGHRLIEHLSQAYLAQLGIALVGSLSAGPLVSTVVREIGLTTVALVGLAARHGLARKPGTIAVTLRRAAGRIRLTVADDGAGELDPSHPQQRETFEVIREHAAALRATVCVSSRPAYGSVVALMTGPVSVVEPSPPEDLR